MKKLFTVLLFSLSCSVSAQTRFCDVPVLKVYDGDTITVDVDGQKVRVRVSEIDAPELAQPYGKESRDYLARILDGKKVCLDKHGVDVYQRWLADVYVGTFSISRLMVASGSAWVYSEYSHDALLRSAQQRAKVQKVGLWADPNPMPPWEYRKNKRYKLSVVVKGM